MNRIKISVVCTMIVRTKARRPLVGSSPVGGSQYSIVSVVGSSDGVG